MGGMIDVDPIDLLGGSNPYRPTPDPTLNQGLELLASGLGQELAVFDPRHPRRELLKRRG
jgi:hypothetical protein